MLFFPLFFVDICRTTFKASSFQLLKQTKGTKIGWELEHSGFIFNSVNDIKISSSSPNRRHDKKATKMKMRSQTKTLANRMIKL